MCGFCEEEKLLLNYTNLTTYIEENNIVIRIFGKANFLNSFEINYCPKCGKKLGDD